VRYALTFAAFGALQVVSPKESSTPPSEPPGQFVLNMFK
jgi:hypothetical protein